MKIFQVIPQFVEGGAERFVVDLCNTLIENYSCKIVLIVFFSFDRNHILAKELNPEIDLIVLDKKLGFDFSIVRKLDHLVTLHKPDVIHTHLNAFEYLFYDIIKYRNKINFINTIHNSPNWMYRNKIVKYINSLLYSKKRVTPVIISSDSIAEFKKLFPRIDEVLIFNGRPIVNASNKIETVQKEVASYKKSPATKVFINVARISPQKNQLMLVDAFNQLIEEGEDVILLIVGTFWDQEIIAEINVKIKDRIYLLGYKDNPTDYLSCSDAFCLSSFHEGMPISLIESIQEGIIPICTPAGGVKDIITPAIGFISYDFSTLSYIASLKAFLKLDDIKRMEMSKKAKIRYENNYTMKITASKYYQLYEN
jgi:glycosyltransferase involved in cell wall biosynthesis